MDTYTLVEDSHHRKFLKEEGYGFVAQVLQNPEGDVSVLRRNKGVDMDPVELINVAERLLKEGK